MEDLTDTKAESIQETNAREDSSTKSGSCLRKQGAKTDAKQTEQEE